jgi:predicted HTH transcriptional regulator
MKKYKIFISGVQKELKEERRAIKDFVSNDVLLRDHFDVFLFEDHPAKGKSSETAYIEEVCGCDIYIGILGNRYGSVEKGKISPTEAEFREAQKKHKVILIYIKGENGAKDHAREDGIRKLIAEIKDPKKGYSYRRFVDVPGFKNLVYESLVAFLREKGIVGRDAFDQRVCSKAKLSDIDEKKIRWFLKVAREKRNFPLEVTTSVKEVLTHLNLLREGELTNAAVLLFGKDPHKIFLQAEVKCIQFPSTEVEKPFTSYHIYDGNLFEQVDRAVSFVLDAIRLPVIQQEHTAQVKRPHEIPVFAIQEAIVNAVAHRDYETTSGVQVMIFLDRVEVWNSGSLPSKLKLSDLKRPHASYPNNPLLASALYLANYIQRAGSGTIEMVKQCKAQGLPEPDFVSIRNDEFRAILPRDIYTEATLSQLGLIDRQKKAVQYVKNKGSISRKEYVVLTGVSVRQANFDLADLLKKKVFAQAGKGRSVKYTLRG